MKPNVGLPTPKLVIISSDRPQQCPQPQVKAPADFRWGFVEEFLRSHLQAKSNRRSNLSAE